MLAFPGCKINVGLKVLSKREDGYHNIQSLFYPVQLSDVLEVIPSESGSFEQTGIQINGPVEGNLVLIAESIMKERFNLPPHRIHLHKIVPSGAGLGGGSADASATIKLLDKIHSLKLSDSELQSLAADVGSDCPFFIQNEPSIVTGRGEHIRVAEAPFSGVWIKIVKGALGISTAAAFAGITPSDEPYDYDSILAADQGIWSDVLKNDFEKPAFAHITGLREAAQSLSKEGAFYVSLTGSGSAIYGLYNERPSNSSDIAFQWISQL